MGTILLTLEGTGFAWLMTSLGAAIVFLIRKEMKESFNKIFLGFAAGVMIAASVWSLLIPAIEQAEVNGDIGWIPASGGFILGAIFLLLMDKLIPHLHIGEKAPEGPRSSWQKTTLMVFAVTLHNIPEGMAMGLAFANASLNGGTATDYAAAFALALGIGIQNFPEGAAIALPLKKEGTSSFKAFLCGSLSGIVEPIAGVITVLLAQVLLPYMPWLLSFAAGAMIYVVVEELIPEAHLGEHSHIGTLGVMAGFLIMMILDVALG
ncbi:MAG TPA: ZIP family metal transporter [Lachnospiraceae bacterium]|nr:ZIP family metal transporter [Lachnospiraceae bacterium]